LGQACPAGFEAIGTNKFGSVNKTDDELTITVEFREAVECSGQVLTDCRNAWKSLPPLQPIPNLEPMSQAEAAAQEQADASISPPAEPGQA